MWHSFFCGKCSNLSYNTKVFYSVIYSVRSDNSEHHQLMDYSSHCCLVCNSTCAQALVRRGSWCNYQCLHWQTRVWPWDRVCVVPSNAPAPANTRTCLHWPNRAKKKERKKEKRKHATRAANTTIAGACLMTFPKIRKTRKVQTKLDFICGTPLCCHYWLIAWSHFWASINVCDCV